MSQRSRYWSCTKFADWLRGTPKPYAETMEGWDAWRQQAETAHPWRYWLADEGLDHIQNAIHTMSQTKSTPLNTISITDGLLVLIVFLPLLAISSLVVGVTWVIGFCHACLVSLWTLLKSN